jgi:hypothetical protein
LAFCSSCSFCYRLRIQCLRTLWAGLALIPFLILLRIQRPIRGQPDQKRSHFPKIKSFGKRGRTCACTATGQAPDIPDGNRERYIIFESHENVRFSGISCGSMKAPDVLLSPSNPVAKIVLLSTSASRWKWNASLSSTPKVSEHN